MKRHYQTYLLKLFLSGLMFLLGGNLMVSAQPDEVTAVFSENDSSSVIVTLPDSVDRPVPLSDSLFTAAVSSDSAAVLVPLPDSISAAADSVLAGMSVMTSRFVPDPQRALWLSLIIPGAGQIYNRKLWKIPIVYGGFLGCLYALTWNNQMYSDYSQAYLDIMDDDPNTKSYMNMLPINYDITGREDQYKEIFKNKKNYYRKYRDMSIFAMIGVYLLSVVDAYVDAELSSFDISRDLSLRLQPTVFKTGGNLSGASAGIQFNFTLK